MTRRLGKRVSAGTIVCDGNFLAVAASREEQAIKAAYALRASAKWRESPDLPPAAPALFDHLQKVVSVDSVVLERGLAPVLIEDFERDGDRGTAAT